MPGSIRSAAAFAHASLEKMDAAQSFKKLPGYTGPYRSCRSPETFIGFNWLKQFGAGYECGSTTSVLFPRSSREDSGLGLPETRESSITSAHAGERIVSASGHGGVDI